jgi:hypothetical protein
LGVWNKATRIRKASVDDDGGIAGDEGKDLEQVVPGEEIPSGSRGKG